MQMLSQLFLALNALILASLFLSTAGIYSERAESQTKIFWLLSVALTTSAFLMWSLVPLLTPAFASLASFLFIASAASLGLLFRSWRSTVSPRLIIGVTVTVVIVGIVCELAEEGGSAVIRISDNGPGVPAAYQDHIFELFKSQKSCGMGFGLWLCRHIIEQRHRGSISLENRAGQGACFVLHLTKA